MELLEAVMADTRRKQALSFLVTVTIFHVVTYFIFGFIASSLFRYKELFELPVIGDYYRPFGSVSTVLGPLIQILRGVIFGLALLPFRTVIRESRHSWLFIWGLFVGIGILGTPAAAPSSIEGMVYSKLPLWFHAIGIPEIGLQTLVFSLLVFNKFSDKKPVSSATAKTLLRAASTASFSFIGYTVISIAFALLAKAKISESGADFRVLGQFILPLAFSFAAALISRREWFWGKHAALYVASALALVSYQSFVLGEGNWVYAVIAPILPVAISLALTGPKAAKPLDGA